MGRRLQPPPRQTGVRPVARGRYLVRDSERRSNGAALGFAVLSVLVTLRPRRSFRIGRPLKRPAK